MSSESEWETFMAGYDPAERYVNTTNKKGFSTSPRVPVPPYLVNEISVLIAKGKSSYRTSNDFYRDAIYHRLVYVANHDDEELKPVAKIFAVESQMIREQEQRDALKNIIKHAEMMLVNTYPKDRPGLIKQLLEQAAQLPERSRDEMMQLLKGYGA